MVLSQRTIQSIPMRGASESQGLQKEGKEKTLTYTGAPTLELCNCVASPKAFLSRFVPKLLPLTRSRHQCHIFRSISGFFIPSEHHQKCFLFSQPCFFSSKNLSSLQQWPASVLTTHGPHLDSSSVNVPPCLSILCPGVSPGAVPCWIG